MCKTVEAGKAVQKSTGKGRKREFTKGKGGVGKINLGRRKNPTGVS